MRKMVGHLRLLKQVVNEAAGEKTPEAWRFSLTHPELSEQLFFRVGYVEDFLRRERSWVSCLETLEAAQNFRQQGRRKRDD
jgi:hypothetical protein